MCLSFFEASDHFLKDTEQIFSYNIQITGRFTVPPSDGFCSDTDCPGTEEAAQEEHTNFSGSFRSDNFHFFTENQKKVKQKIYCNHFGIWTI
ncbi:MAG: hypothetical protein DRI57_05630 [Deltaproteobacteria bacterium]|nr:MAG: hypothetical protein DRI57_05630 [Deltaproteobacteria bacterium]